MEITGKSTSIDNELRQNRRDKLKGQQEFNRLKAFDSNRSVGSETISEQDVTGLCSRIKRRKHATEEDLRKLSNAFIQSDDNISAFIKIIGAINVVIKEFTGSDRIQQLLAAQCLCNLSLGDEASCSKIATFAGSYMMIFAMASDVTLARICLWITQNIIASGAKPMGVLMSQELLNNTIHILNVSVDLEQEAIQLLDLIIDGKWSELTLEEKQEVKKSSWEFLKRNFKDAMALQVFYKVAMLEGSIELNQGEVVNALVVNLKKSNDEHVLYFTVRLLALACQQDEHTAGQFLEQIIRHNIKLSSLINTAAENPKLFNLVKDLMHLTSRLITNQHPSVAQYFKLDPPESIRIPMLFEF